MNDNNTCNLPVDYKEKIDKLISNTIENTRELRPFQILEQILDQLSDIYGTYNLKLPNFISWNNLKTELILNRLLDLEYNCSPVIIGDDDLCRKSCFQEKQNMTLYQSSDAFKRAFSKWLSRECHTTPPLLYDFICSHCYYAQNSEGKKVTYYPEYGHVLIPHLIYQSTRRGAMVPYTHTGLWGLPFAKLSLLKDDAIQLINNPDIIKEEQKELMFYQIEKLFDFNFMEILKSIIEDFAKFHKVTFGRAYNVVEVYGVNKNTYDADKETDGVNEATHDADKETDNVDKKIHKVIDETGAYLLTSDTYTRHTMIYTLELAKLIFSLPSISVKNDVMVKLKEDAQKCKYKKDLFDKYKKDLLDHLRILVPLLQESVEYIVYKLSEESKIGYPRDIKKCLAAKKCQYTDKQIVAMFRQKTLCKVYINSHKNRFISEMYLKKNGLSSSILHEAMEVNITYLIYNYQNENLYFPYPISSQNMEVVLRELKEDNQKISALRLINSFNNAYNSFFPFNEIYSRYLCLSNYWYRV